MLPSEHIDTHIVQEIERQLHLVGSHTSINTLLQIELRKPQSVLCRLFGKDEPYARLSLRNNQWIMYASTDEQAILAAMCLQELARKYETTILPFGLDEV